MVDLFFVSITVKIETKKPSLLALPESKPGAFSCCLLAVATSAENAAHPVCGGFGCPPLAARLLFRKPAGQEFWALTRWYCLTGRDGVQSNQKGTAMALSSFLFGVCRSSHFLKSEMLRTFLKPRFTY